MIDYTKESKLNVKLAEEAENSLKKFIEIQ
jgi:hypothetical protein